MDKQGRLMLFFWSIAFFTAIMSVLTGKLEALVERLQDLVIIVGFAVILNLSEKHAKKAFRKKLINKSSEILFGNDY